MKSPRITRPPRINLARLRRLLAGVNAFGKNPATGGYSRPGFSDADMSARRWFLERLRAAGLAARQDEAANVFGRFGPADGPCVMAGSHLDTVPEGGAFDGALGVCAALECVCAMQDAGLRPQTAIEVAATSEEEGRFGGMLGSQAIAGLVSASWLRRAADADGVKLRDAMSAQGLAAEKAAAAARADVAAFLELHIEQGPVLEAARVPVGIADSVSGVCVLRGRFIGRANHSGTTPMALRADAFAGLAQTAAAIPAIIGECGGEQSRVTIGKVDIRPNAAHTIPGVAEFSLVIRDSDEKIMAALRRRLRREIARAAEAGGLKASVTQTSWLSPTTLDAGLVSMLRAEAAAHNLPHLVMPSGAGHDAQTMQALCPAALIFVPSKSGISHAPEESSDWDDIRKGAQLMLAALIRLSGAK
jgi:N-carbamoyl-L-amino-acid hydrolase